MRKILRKLGVVLTIITMCLNSSTSVFWASEAEVPYFIINGEEIVYYGEDYEDPETGEYF